MAGQYNFTIKQGEDLVKQLTWDINGVLVDLTGYTAKLKAKKNYDTDVILIDMSTSNGRIILGGAAGTITLNLPNSVTTLLDFTTAIYDLELISAGGNVTCLLEGTITLKRGVTL